MKPETKQSVRVEIKYDHIEALANKLREYTVGNPNFTAVDLQHWIQKSPQETAIILNALIMFCFVMNVKPRVVVGQYQPQIRMYRILKPGERMPLLQARIDHLESQRQAIDGQLSVMDMAKQRIKNPNQINHEKNIS